MTHLHEGVQFKIGGNIHHRSRLTKDRQEKLALASGSDGKESSRRKADRPGGKEGGVRD